MKTKISILAALAYAVVSFAATVGCVNKSNASSENTAGDTLALNLYDTLHGVNWTDSITGTPNPDPSANIGGGYWNHTYDGTKPALRFDDFVLTHSSTGSGGGGTMGYWDGFTTGSNGDNRNYGYADTTGHSGSVNWVANQWGIMAGGGIDSNYVMPVKGDPYLIAYWGYYLEAYGQHSLQISLEDGSLFAPQEIYICNHPWPYWGNFYGDGFARPLNQPGDYFKLFIRGIKSDGTLTADSVEHTLAEYDSMEPLNVYQPSSWEPISLTKLGGNLKSIYFTMKSTDELIIGDKNYGPNTAVYFNMDKLKVVNQGIAPTSAGARQAQTGSPKAIEVKDYFPVASHTGGDITVHDANGKQVLKTTVKAGEKVNLSKLPKGEYRLLHGHRHIPITKK
jgi:hypothetical protein